MLTPALKLLMNNPNMAQIVLGRPVPLYTAVESHSTCVHTLRVDMDLHPELRRDMFTGEIFSE
ncbi:MAG: hypothetical protein NTAFB01_43050 [Nitrospira sp.]